MRICKWLQHTSLDEHSLLPMPTATTTWQHNEPGAGLHVAQADVFNQAVARPLVLWRVGALWGVAWLWVFGAWGGLGVLFWVMCCPDARVWGGWLGGALQLAVCFWGPACSVDGG